MFLRDDFLHLDVVITPLQLRLLLCAIQTQVVQHAQTARFVTMENVPADLSMPSTSSSFAVLRHEELQNLLVRWYILRKRILGPSNVSEVAVACTLMYHLISMELHICFDDVQLLAGKDGLEGGKLIISPFQRWAKSSSCLKAIAHAGQVIKVLQCKDYDILRPLWWPVAVYRAALVLWSYAVALSLAAIDDTGKDESPSSGTHFMSVNNKAEEVGPYGKVVQLGEGVPCLSASQGALVPLHQISDILSISLEILEDGKDRSTPLCGSVQELLQDIQRCGIPYSNL